MVGGCEMSLVIAAAFTASNGEQFAPTSLHYVSPTGNYNPHQHTLHAACQLLEPHDSNNLYPVYGFGAKLCLPDGSLTPAQHCFPVYASGTETKGAQGVLQAYQDALQVVILSGPTLFAPFIENAAQRRAAAANSS
jgi:hypothetical protein